MLDHYFVLFAYLRGLHEPWRWEPKEMKISTKSSDIIQTET
jgi:hypothetical protein